MAVAKVTRVLSLLIFILLSQLCSAQYEIPDVTIQAFTPKGFKAFIPDAQNVTLFAFEGNVNQGIENNAGGIISGEVVQATNGQWVFEDPNVKLSIGDVISYYVFVSINGAGFLRDNLSYTVTGLVDKYGGDDTIVFPSVTQNVPDIPNRVGTETNTKPQGTFPPIPPTAQVTPPPAQVTPLPAQVTTLPAQVTPLPAQVTPAPAVICQPTLTIVSGRKACAGETVFEDNFDSLNADVWQVEQYIPSTHLDYPFVSYQQRMVSTDGSNLRVRAILQQNEQGFSNDTIALGSLDLSNGCTSSTEKCVVNAWGADILPPVATGRVTSKQFAFTYGTVHIRAKLPQGDWLYPVMLLEPLLKVYGKQNLASGVFKIACARGNRELYLGYENFGNQVLYGGPIIDSGCPNALLTSKLPNSNQIYWGDDFHVYSLRWTPESMTLLVDGQQWAYFEPTPTAKGFRNRLPTGTIDGTTCVNPVLNASPPSGSKVTPFDQLFSLAFGVDAGGINDFKDGIFSTKLNLPKPWKNKARKARLNFFEQTSDWFPTWSQPELLIDYVKVVAL